MSTKLWKPYKFRVCAVLPSRIWHTPKWHFIGQACWLWKAVQVTRMPGGAASCGVANLWSLRIWTYIRFWSLNFQPLAGLAIWLEASVVFVQIEGKWRSYFQLSRFSSCFERLWRLLSSSLSCYRCSLGLNCKNLENKVSLHICGTFVSAALYLSLRCSLSPGLDVILRDSVHCSYD